MEKDRLKIFKLPAAVIFSGGAVIRVVVVADIYSGAFTRADLAAEV